MWAALALMVVVATAWARLFLWARAGRSGAAPAAPPWRLPALMALQAVTAILLHLTLFPPPSDLAAGTLVVATAGAPATFDLAPTDHLIALPEAGAIEGAERVPDLASALRRQTVARIRVEGWGLPARDRAALSAPVTFAPRTPPPGLADVALPRTAAPGGLIRLGGRVDGLPAVWAELADPAGTVVDRRRVPPGARFELSGRARTEGLALFELRLRDDRNRVIQRLAAPVVTRASPAPRVLILAGAPGPEVQQVRRWAEEAGVDLSIEIDLGAGVRTGDPATPLTAQALDRLDLVVVDDRAWESLPAAVRSSLVGAVERGLGLLLRPAGPASPNVEQDWRRLGLPVVQGAAPVETRLPDQAGQSEAAGDSGPALTVRPVTGERADTVSLLRDQAGAPLAFWRVQGRGRVGLWTVADSYVLARLGDANRYGALWSELFATLARPESASSITTQGLAIAGMRATACGVPVGTVVVQRERNAIPLIVDPASGPHRCAAIFAEQPGWLTLREPGGAETPVYVHEPAQVRSLTAWEDRIGTLDLAVQGVDRRAPTASRATGSPWPWFLGLLAALAILWTLERRRPRRDLSPDAV